MTHFEHRPGDGPSPRIALRLPRDLHDRLLSAAAAENRTVSNYVQTLLVRHLPAEQLVLQGTDEDRRSA